MRTVVFFGSARTGKTTLVYHLASMLAELGESVLAVDLDPNPDLTNRFLPDAVLESFWNVEPPHTVCRVLDGHRFTASVDENPGITLLIGDPDLAALDEGAARRLVERATQSETAWTLVDVGPNLGVLNRAAVRAADCIVIPLRPDRVSWLSLRTFGSALRGWRIDSSAVGYIVMQHGVWGRQWVNAEQYWTNRLSELFRQSVLGETPSGPIAIESDPYCFGILRSYRSLLPMATDARKPVFSLKPADGAIGAHVAAVQNAHAEFRTLAQRIAAATPAPAPWPPRSLPPRRP